MFQAPPAVDPKPKTGGSYPQDFEAVWAALPRSPNASKKDAFAAWVKTQRARPPIDILVRCAQAYAAEIAARTKMRPHDPPGVCHASTWLHGHRWEGYMTGVEKSLTKAAAEAMAPPAPSWAGSIIQTIGREEFDVWFAGVEFHAGPPPVLIVTRPLVRDRMESRYGHFLERCLGVGVTVELRR